MKTEINTEYYYIHFTMAFTSSIAILLLLLIACSIEANSEQGRDVIVHEGMSILVIPKRLFLLVCF
jgi:hypothetical protein